MNPAFSFEKEKGTFYFLGKSRMFPLWARTVRAILKATCEPWSGHCSIHIGRRTRRDEAWTGTRLRPPPSRPAAARRRPTAPMPFGGYEDILILVQDDLGAEQRLQVGAINGDSVLEGKDQIAHGSGPGQRVVLGLEDAIDSQRSMCPPGADLRECNRATQEVR